MTPGDSGDSSAVVIVGGGIVGLSIARRLAQDNFVVSVFDQSVAGGEASWAGAGMLAPGGEVDDSNNIAPLALESRRMYGRFIHQLEEESGLPIDYQECGGLDVAYSEKELTELEARAERQRNLGIRSKHILAGQAVAFWPRLRREGLLGGQFYPEDAIVNPREVTHALKGACRQSSVSIFEHLRINALRVSANAITALSDSAAEAFDIAIIAAGAWSSAIEVVGVPPLPPAEPVRGHLIGYRQPEQTCNTIVRHCHTYLLQRSNGLLIAGSSMERVGFDRERDPRVEADLASRAEFLMPHLTDTSPIDTWIGFRPASDDLHIGRWHSRRLYLAYGHFRNGILLAPVTAEKVAAEISANWQMR